MTGAKLLKFIDSTLGAFLCRLAGRFSYQSTIAPVVIADKTHRILVIRPGGMGDMIILLPVLRKLREMFPQAEVDLVCEKRNREVLDLAELEVNVLLYNGNPFSFLSSLLKNEYQLCVDTEQFHHFSALFARLSGASVRIGFKINPLRNPLYTHLVNYAPDGYEGEQFMRLLGPAGANDTPYTLEKTVSTPEDALPPEKQAMLKDAIGDVPFVVLHPGASTKHKRWPPDRFFRLATMLAHDLKLSLVLLGTRKETELTQALAADMRRKEVPCVSFAGNLDLRETAALLKQAVLFVGPDSGVAHLAEAVGTSTVVLFGPSDHQKWAARGTRHAVVRKHQPCAPCFIFGYHKPCRTIACMNNIEVRDVVAACEGLLSSDESPAHGSMDDG